MRIPTTPGDRIRQARKAKGWTQSDLAETCGFSGASRIGNYESGVSEPKGADYLLMADALNVTASWLQFGEPMIASEPGQPYTVDDIKYAFIKRYNVKVGMGSGTDNGHEEISGTHAYRRDWLERNKLTPNMLAVVDGLGDSMYPTIFDGDVVLVNTAEKKITNGKVYAFNTDEGVRIKRLFRQLDGRLLIVSDNPDKTRYPDEFLTPGMNVDIIGRVVHRSGGV